MVGIFANCRKFNKELKWNVENVENMGFMFYFCEDFNNGGKPLKWNVEKVKSMYGMFEFCKNLKVPINFLNFNNECDTEDIIKGIPDENNLVINKNENKLVINQPTANQPTANQPTANQPTSNPPTANQPTTNQPTTEKKSYFKGFMGFQKYFKRGGRITRKQKGKKVHQKKSRKILLLKTK